MTVWHVIAIKVEYDAEALSVTGLGVEGARAQLRRNMTQAIQDGLLKRHMGGVEVEEYHMDTLIQEDVE